MKQKGCLGSVGRPCPSPPAPRSLGLTFPWATSSLWAAEAAFTSALVAAAMDFAASRICSSKLRLSSACWGGEGKGRESKAGGERGHQCLLPPPSPQGLSGVLSGGWGQVGASWPVLCVAATIALSALWN